MPILKHIILLYLLFIQLLNVCTNKPVHDKFILNLLNQLKNNYHRLSVIKMQFSNETQCNLSGIPKFKIYYLDYDNSCNYEISFDK